MGRSRPLSLIASIAMRVDINATNCFEAPMLLVFDETAADTTLTF